MKKFVIEDIPYSLIDWVVEVSFQREFAFGRNKVWQLEQNFFQIGPFCFWSKFKWWANTLLSPIFDFGFLVQWNGLFHRMNLNGLMMDPNFQFGQLAWGRLWVPSLFSGRLQDQSPTELEVIGAFFKLFTVHQEFVGVWWESGHHLSLWFDLDSRFCYLWSSGYGCDCKVICFHSRFLTQYEFGTTQKVYKLDRTRFLCSFLMRRLRLFGNCTPKGD